MILTPSSGPPVADWKRGKRGREEKANINATTLLKAILQPLRVVMGGEVYSMRPLAKQTTLSFSVIQGMCGGDVSAGSLTQPEDLSGRCLQKPGGLRRSCSGPEGWAGGLVSPAESHSSPRMESPAGRGRRGERENVWCKLEPLSIRTPLK